MRINTIITCFTAIPSLSQQDEPEDRGPDEHRHGEGVPHERRGHEGGGEEDGRRHGPLTHPLEEPHLHHHFFILLQVCNPSMSLFTAQDQ